MRLGTTDARQLTEILDRKIVADRTFIPQFQGFARPFREAQTAETKMQQRASE
jgi:hypothetical protein